LAYNTSMNDTNYAQLAKEAIRHATGIEPSASPLLTSLGYHLTIHSQPRHERLMRLGFEATVAKLPFSIRYPITNLMKKIRNPKSTVPIASMKDLFGYNLVRDLIKNDIPKFFYEGSKGVIVLTHDVDNLVGWNMLPEALKDLRSRHLPATFNFLTRADYPLDYTVLDRLATAGHEIGLHGSTHDIALAFRSEASILQTLRRGRTALQERPSGFRSPAFSVSHALFKALDGAGFVYDSSIQVASTFYHSTSFPFPYRLPGFDLIELPLTFNDDMVVRDAPLSDQGSLRVFSELLDDTLAVGGVFVANIHPHNLVGRMGLYESILELVQEKKSAGTRVTTAGQIVDIFGSRLAQ